jgi:diguanylate cyclase (GGDEF)-like protein
MATRIEKAFRIGSVSALVLFLGACAMVYRSTKRLIGINHLVEHSQEVLVNMEGLQSALDEAVSSTRNYVLSGDESNLERFAKAKPSMSELLGLVRSLTVDNPVQQERARQLEPQLAATFGYWEDAIAKRKGGESVAADQLMSSARALGLMRDDRRLIVAMIRDENQLLGLRSREAEASARRAIGIELLLGVATLAILAWAYFFVQMDMNAKAKALKAQQESEEKLRGAHDNLNTALRESQARARDSAELSNLGDLLQSCQTVEEACNVSASVLPLVFESRPGALCITSPSRNIVETLAVWNACSSSEQVFGPEDCWALRRGKLQAVADPNSALRCAHVSGSLAGGYLCVPLAAQGETLGVLYMEDSTPELGSSPGPLRFRQENLERLAAAVGERISLALANLKLREILSNQSIRDPLTGLFNRRYMEESLARELHRGARKNRSVALVMLDLDHFKVFNDTFGHQAGDMLLQELSTILKTRVRAGDVACRYGGEEFAVILSETDAEGARLCLDKIRAEIKHLHLHHRGQALGAVTMSAGVAVFPGHGETAEELLRVADQALYRAKSEGRDRVLFGSPLLNQRTP